VEGLGDNSLSDAATNTVYGMEWVRAEREGGAEMRRRKVGATGKGRERREGGREKDCRNTWMPSWMLWASGVHFPQSYIFKLKPALAL
jgi:hypothetical protein